MTDAERTHALLTRGGTPTHDERGALYTLEARVSIALARAGWSGR
jgi:hypothetical protein